MRPRYAPGRPLNVPLQAPDSNYATPQKGAVVAPNRVPFDGQGTAQSRPTPIPFDLLAIVDYTTLSQAGIVNTLIGPGAAKQIGPVPATFRGVVDGIFPYLETWDGTVIAGRVPLAGTDSVVWSVSVDNVPDPYYGSLSSVITPFNGMSDRALIAIRPSGVLSSTVVVTDTPTNSFAWIGMRLKGRWIPVGDER